MRRLRLDRRGRVTGIRLTEEPTIYGLVIQERGERIEFVSFADAWRRQEAPVHHGKASATAQAPAPQTALIIRRSTRATH